MAEKSDIPGAQGARAACSLTHAAEGALAAVVEAGVECLIAEPWRVARILRDAEAMTLDELALHATRRRRMGARQDFNRAIGLAQLSLALGSPRFQAAWTRWREDAARP